MDSPGELIRSEPDRPAGSASQPSAAPAIDPAAEPLRNIRHERFAFARAAMMGFLEAARHAGYESMTAANAAKLDRQAKVRARIRFLAGDAVKTVQLIREKVTRKLHLIGDVSMADFIRMAPDPDALAAANSIKNADKRAAAIAALPLLPYLDLRGVASLPPEQQREILSTVKSVAHTEHGPKFELHDPLNAIAQLRKLVGLDAPEKLDLTGDLTLEHLIGNSYRPAAARNPVTIEHEESKNE